MGVCGTTQELCREEDVFEVSVFVPDNKSYLRAHGKSHFFALKTPHTTCMHTIYKRFRLSSTVKPRPKMLIKTRTFENSPVYRGTQRRFPPKCIENKFQAIQSRSLEMYSSGAKNSHLVLPSVQLPSFLKKKSEKHSLFRREKNLVHWFDEYI